MKAYSMDLRERVLAACDEGMMTAEVAEALAVSPAWVRRLKQRRRQAGEVAPAAPSAPARPLPSLLTPTGSASWSATTPGGRPPSTATCSAWTSRR